MKDFLGKGIGFPMRINAYGALETASHDASVSQAVELILGTALGERVMEPEFGCRIHDFLFHPVSANTCASITLAALDALHKWEHRIENLKIDSYPDPDAENSIMIDISYMIAQTNTIRNLVFPFYLRREQDL
jgi:uncharacterized protein